MLKPPVVTISIFILVICSFHTYEDMSSEKCTVEAHFLHTRKNKKHYLEKIWNNDRRIIIRQKAEIMRNIVDL